MKPVRSICVLLGFWLFGAWSENTLAQTGITTIRLPTEYPVVDLLHRLEVARPRIGLALSGGGARGFAHIGVLMALEAGGIPIDYIAGSSMGSIVGGLYAAGYSPAELRQMALETDWGRLFLDDPGRPDLFVTQKMDQTDHTVQVRFDGMHPQIPSGLSAGQKLQMLFTSLTASANYLAGGDFTKLRTPFLAVATDLTTGNRVVLDKGNLAESIRASAAVPVIFSPVPSEKGLLVDGGIVEPLPVDLVREMGADVVLAVNTQDTLRGREQLMAPWDVVDQVITISIMRNSLEQRGRADLVITPPIGDHASSGFSNIAYLIDQGREATLPLIPRIRALSKPETTEVQFADQQIASVTIDDGRETAPHDGARVLQVQPGRTVGESRIRADLETFYGEGKYAAVEAEVYDDDSGRHIKYRLTGNRLLTDFSITGETMIPDGSLAALIRSEQGLPIDFRTLREDADRVLKWYHKRGYELAHLAEFSADLESGKVAMVIDEGRVAAVQVTGSKRTRDWAILREFPISTGDIYDASAAQRGITNIHSTGLFQSITMEIVRSNGRPVIRIDVRERSSLSAKFGARVDRERSAEGLISLTETNLLGTGSRVTGRVDYGSRRQRFGLDFRSDRVFRTYLTYRISLYRHRDDRYVYDGLRQTGDFREKRSGVRITLGQQIARLGAVSLSARIEGNEVRTRAGVSPTGRSDIRSVTLRSQVDNLDRYPFPSFGHLHNAWIEATGEVFGGHQKFIRAHASLEWYHTLARRVTVRPQFVFGLGEGTIPFAEQFSLGGQHSFFGYREDQFRGTYLLRGSLMIRTQLVPRVYLDTRYDTGGLWQKRREFRWDDLRHGAGFGIALDTPLGPIQAHYGTASNRASRFYVNLGHRF